jgi:putative transposase
MPRTVLALLGDFLHLIALGMRSHKHLAVENLFLRKQLAFYAERRLKPRRLDDATRLTLVVLARFIEWRSVLTVVQPETLLRWPPGLSPVLAVEVTAPWTSATSRAPPGIDR